MIKPHGGKLIERRLVGLAREAACEKARTLPKIALD